ncbi:MAG: IPT/TIG domain-containing protein [Candidatus Sericytochromatia bacterium]
MKKTALLTSLLLLSCQATPAPTGPQAITPPALLAPAGPLSPSGIRQTLPAPSAEHLESAVGQVRSEAQGDRLALRVIIQRPAMRIQAFDLTRIKFLKGLIKAADLTQTYVNQGGENGFIPVQASESSLQITGIPKGRNRIVEVQAYGEPLTPGGAPQLLEGVVLKAIYSSVEGQDNLEVRFTLQSTLAANVLEQIMSQDPELASEIDSEALTELVHQISQGPETPAQNPFAGTPLPPGRLDPEGIANSIISGSNSSPVIPATPTTSLPDSWIFPGQNVEITAQNPAGTAYTHSQIVVQIGDSASAPQIIAPGESDLSLNFPDIPPGTWEVTASLQDEEGVIRSQERLLVIVSENGDPPQFTTLSGAPLTTAALTLPPLLESLSDESGTPQSAFPGGSIVILRGDGFDLSEGGIHNTVTINGQEVELAAGFPVTATSLAVVLPPNLEGSDLNVTISTQDKVSNALDLDILPAIIALDEPVLNGTLAAEDPGRIRILTVAGFDPQDYPELQLQFVDENGQPLPDLVAPLATNNSEIRVQVPPGAGTGTIGVILTPGGTPLPSPVLNIVGAGPAISSTAHQSGAGQTFTVTGSGFIPGTNADESPRTGVSLAGNPLPPGSYTVIDENTLEITIPALGYAPGTSPTFEICTQLEGIALGCDSETVSLLNSPTVTDNDWPGGNSPITITGTYFVPGDTQVTVNGVPVPPEDLTVTPTGLSIVPPDGTPPGATVVVTTPGGSVSSVLPLYSALVNFIGSSTAYEASSNWPYYTLISANPTVTYSISDPHGISVHNCEAIYTVGNNSLFLYKFSLAGQFQWRRTMTAVSEDVGTDANGTVYVAATGGNRIDTFNPLNGDAYGSLATSEAILGPEGLEMSADGRYMYVSSNSSPNSTVYNANNTVKVFRIDLSASGTKPVTLVAGGSQRPDVASATEALSEARFYHLEGLGLDAQNNIYVAEADAGHRQIRKIDQVNQTVTVHASFPAGFAIHEIRVEPDGSVIVPGENSQKIYRIDPLGMVSVITGTGAYGLRQGPLETGTFSTPVGVDFDPDGNLYIADRSWGIRKIERLQPRSGTKVCP